MQAGKIKWFNNAKGWGFITSEDGKNEIFLHFSSIIGNGYKMLKAGQPVNYSAELRPKGLFALEVIPLPLKNSGKQ